MKQHLKYILLILIFIGTLQQSIAQTTISSSVTLTQTVLNGYTWPVTVNGGSVGSPVIVMLGEDVTLSNALNYFIINGDYVTIEGNNKTITLSGVSNYLGLIKNGKSTANGFNNLTIQNLGVLSNSSSGNINAGWIGQQYFSKNATNNLVINCYSNGTIGRGMGGIVGQKSSGTVQNCYSSGSMNDGGGIFGNLASYGTAINCFSTGNIISGGGIYGYGASNSTATNCYSAGAIGSYGGGIYGTDVSNSTATNCYSAGSISTNGGGIYGSNASNSTTTNCYSANGTWVSNDANTALTGEDGTVWNTNTSPYTLIAFATYNNLGLIDTRATSAAYSLRLLYPNYTGPLARITIGSSFYDVYPDNSSSKIFSLNSTISNSYNAYNATTTGATSNLLSSIVSSNTTASVAIWYDQTGNNAHADQSSTNTQPRIINAGEIDNKYSYPAITFQNTNQYLQYSNNLTVQTINTVRAVPNLDYQTLIAMPANTDFSVRGANGNIYNIIPNPNDWSIGTSPNKTWVNGNQNVNFTKNNMHTAIIAAQNPITSNLSISSTFSSRGMTNGASVNELVLFPDNLTSLERTTIENNQVTEYSIGLISSDISPSLQSVAINETPTNLSITSDILSATFQWYSNINNNNTSGTLINGAINNTYTPNTTSEGTLYYYVKVSANNKTIPSDVATVRTGIEITTQPSTSNQTVIIGNTVTPISIQATGSNITYQWYENTISDNLTGILISGATSSTYTPPNSTVILKYYYCEVSGINTILTSNISGFIRIIGVPIIWNGSAIIFTKQNYADYNLSQNQDILTSSVKLTRANQQGLFNIASENSYDWSSPSNTEWAQGTLSDYQTLNYQNWIYTMSYNPQNQIGRNFVVHLINENIYLQLTLISWTDRANGGGFSYSRTTPSLWGLSPNGLKTQDNTIQLNINGKKGTTSPVNENGKVN